MNDWENAIEDNKVVTITPNLERAKSLRVNALRLLKVVEDLKLNKENGFFILTNLYDVILESMHSILYQQGYKVLDHLSVGFYIKDILKNLEFFHIFDKYRKLRNGILYYGRDIDFDTAKQGIADLKRLYRFIDSCGKNENR